MFYTQKTVANRIEFRGKGLHSGRMVRMTVFPTEANHGIRFKRTDEVGAASILAHVDHVTPSDLCTTLGTGENSIGTIEHLMAAFAGLGIDNALVTINAPEVPIMDGSAKVFVRDLSKVGLRDLRVGKELFVVKKRFEFKQGDRSICIEPHHELSISCTIDFKTRSLASSSMSLA